MPSDYDKQAFVLNAGLFDGARRMPIVPDHGEAHDRAHIATIRVE